MYYVYRFIDKKKNIIYVGKSKQKLEQRFNHHKHLPDKCYELTYKIEYIECPTESDMSIKEIYYINKFRHEGVYFNILDMTDVPISIEITDKWKQYKGPLPEQFRNSINFTKEYAKQKEVRYNQDGSINQVKSYKEKGKSTFVYGLTNKEVDRVLDSLIANLNAATNENQIQIRFRNLLLFFLGINIPHQSAYIFSLRYCDVLDENDTFKDLPLTLSRENKDEVLYVPIKESVKKLIAAYVDLFEMNYENNRDDHFFVTRQHQIMTQKNFGRILEAATQEKRIKKNVGSETLRKTYFLNVYHTAKDKLNAILFLSKFSAGMRDASIIRYLNLTNEDIDYDYYFSEKFSIGNIDLAQIKCINQK